MIFTSSKINRLHTCVNREKKHLHTSAVSDKTYSRSLPKSSSIDSTKPLLCFTSFQHYLEDCNQNEFHKKEDEKFYRSVNKAKTQAYFTYQKEKSTSESKRKNIKNFTLEDSVIQPFDPQEGESTRYLNNRRSKRNFASKTSSDHYLPQSNEIAEGIFSEKFGTIEGWNSDQKVDKNERVFLSSKSILQERKLNSIKNRMLKTSQNSFIKQQKQKSKAQEGIIPLHKKVFKSKRTSNKENIQHSEIQQISPKQSLTQEQLFRPIQIFHKQKTKNHPLTSINQLEEEILLSKRQPNFPGSFSSRYHKDEHVFQLQHNIIQQNSNIKMLKKQFEYLCKEDFDEKIQEFQTSPASIQHQSSVKDVKNQLKYFKRFPNHDNKQNSTCYPFDSEKFIQSRNRPKTTQHELNPSSPGMLRILESITKTPNEKYLYEAKTPLKRNKKIPQTDVHTSHNMKSISNHKQKFHSSIKDRKSQSAFYYTNGFGGVENDTKDINKEYIKQKGQNSLMITVVSSFNPSVSKQDRKTRWNSKAHSLDKNLKKRISTEGQNIRKDNLVKQSQNCTSLFEKDFISQVKGNDFQNLNGEESFNDLCMNHQQSLSQTIDLLHQTSQDSNILTEQNESLQKLNLLSQQLKNCTKIPGSAKHVSLVNKKFMYLNKAGRIKQRQRNQSMIKIKKKNIIQNLTITQLQGRHIEKLRKKFDLNNE